MNVFEEVGALALSLGETPWNKYEGCWTHKIDDLWDVAVNAHKEPHKAGGGKLMECDVPPFEMAVWYAGWLAGFVPPEGEFLFAAGEGGNIENFMAAVAERTSGLGGAG